MEGSRNARKRRGQKLARGGTRRAQGDTRTIGKSLTEQEAQWLKEQMTKRRDDEQDTRPDGVEKLRPGVMETGEAPVQTERTEPATVVRASHEVVRGSHKVVRGSHESERKVPVSQQSSSTDVSTPNQTAKTVKPQKTDSFWRFG